METIQVKIKAKHFREATEYVSNTSCPLAIALRDHFNTDNVHAMGFGCGCYINDKKYDHNWCSHGLIDDYGHYDKSIQVDDLIKKAKQKKKVGQFIVTLKK
jgi:hypothetical protein